MAAHSVRLKVEHPMNVGNLGVEFEVRRGGKLLGKLEVTQSTIDWTPAKARNPRKASWQEFGEWMDSRGNRRESASRPAPATHEEPAQVDAVEQSDLVDEADVIEEADLGEEADLVEETDLVDDELPNGPPSRPAWS
jgi:hypothetical protein